MEPQELIEECKRNRPGFDQEPAHEKLITMLSLRDLQRTSNEVRRQNGSDLISVPSLGDVFDAMAIVDDAGKDLWLRCEATYRERWIGGMTAFFELGAEMDREEKSPVQQTEEDNNQRGTK